MVKLHPNPQGPNLLANEFLGATLLHGLGFAVPRVTKIQLLDDLPCGNGVPITLNNYPGTLMPSTGNHVGIDYLSVPGFVSVECEPTIFARHNLVGIRLFDIWANHIDARQCIQLRPLGSDGNFGKAWLIDNGHLFGGPRWRSTDMGSYVRSLRLLQCELEHTDNHSLLLWGFRFRSKLPRLLETAIKLIPSEWFSGDVHELKKHYNARLDALSLFATGP